MVIEYAIQLKVGRLPALKCYVYSTYFVQGYL